MKLIKKFNDFISENVELAQPTTKPKTKDPITKPSTPNPTRPTPFRRDKPSVIPKPKAEKKEKEVVNKFLKLSKGNKEIHNLLKYKYE